MSRLSQLNNLKFVQFYRDEECLWNRSIPSYKNKCMRESSLQKMRLELMAIGIQMTIEEIKHKIKNLRATYCQELSKIEKSARSLPGVRDDYKPKIYWFDEMHSFIKNVPMKRKPTDCQEPDTMDEEPDHSETNFDYTDDNIDNNEDPADLSVQPSTSSSDYINQSQPKIPMVTIGSKRKRIAQVASLIDEIRSIKKNIKSTAEYDENFPDENEHDIFGKFVASQLKKLSNIQAILARNEINATLTRFRLQDLHDRNPTFSTMTAYHNSSDSSTTSNTVSKSNLPASDTPDDYPEQKPFIYDVAFQENMNSSSYRKE